MRRAVITLLLAAASWAAAGQGGLIEQLRQAQRFELRGEVETSVFFPPRERPTMRRAELPDVQIVPWLLERNFTVTETGEQRVAGRTVVRYDLVPKHDGANHWSLWFDARWNVLLGIEERSPDGAVVRRAAFTRVAGQPRRRPAAAREQQEAPGFRTAVLDVLPGLRLPAAFQPVGYRTGEVGAEVVFSDGMNVVALVISSRPVRDGHGIATRRIGPHHLWLIGNLPEAQLRASLAGVREVNLAPLEGFAPQRTGDR